MGEHKNVGDILIGFGRLTQREVDRALDYQKQNGGFFGEALLALELVTRQELDWVLASQFDIPYVVPTAEDVDLAAARLVTPEWALSHTALPILQSEDTLTVVVAAPNRETAALEELRVRCGRELRLALASPETVHNLVRGVFDRISRQERPEASSATISEVWEAARRAGAAGIGVTARGPSALAWYEAGGRTKRRPLNARWELDLHRLLDPPPQDAIGRESMGEWRADMECHGIRVRVDVTFLRSRGGTEFFLRRAEPERVEPISPPDPGLVAEISRRIGSGGARLRIVCDPPSLRPVVIPGLPSVFQPDWTRSIHLTGQDDAAPAGVLSLGLSRDSARLAEQIDGVRLFSFDVVTADLAEPSPEIVEAIAGLAPTVFIGGPAGFGEAPGFDDFSPWILRVVENDQGRLDWTLRLRGT